MFTESGPSMLLYISVLNISSCSSRPIREPNSSWGRIFIELFSMSIGVISYTKRSLGSDLHLNVLEIRFTGRMSLDVLSLAVSLETLIKGLDTLNHGTLKLYHLVCSSLSFLMSLNNSCLFFFPL